MQKLSERSIEFIGPQVLSPDISRLDFNGLVESVYTALPEVYTNNHFLDFESIKKLPPILRNDFYQFAGQLKLITEHNAKKIALGALEITYLNSEKTNAVLIDGYNKQKVLKFRSWFYDRKGDGTIIKSWQAAPSGKALDDSATWHSSILAPDAAKLLKDCTLDPAKNFDSIKWLSGLSKEEQLRVDYGEYLKRIIGEKAVLKVFKKDIQIPKINPFVKVLNFLIPKPK